MRYLQNSRQYSERSLNRSFKVGDIVMIRQYILSNASKNVSGKLFPPYNIAKIVRKCESFAYEILKLDGKISKINIKMIKGISKDLQDKLEYLFSNNE